MSDTETKFMAGLLDGIYLLEEVDDFVDKWHDLSRPTEPLHEFLGMTWQEYSLWANDPDILSDIASARVRNVSLTDAVNDNILANLKLAARADKASKIAYLQNWIREQLNRSPR